MKKLFLLACAGSLLLAACFPQDAKSPESQEPQEPIEEKTYTQQQLKYAQGTGQVFFDHPEESGVKETELPESLPILKDVREKYPSGAPKTNATQEEMRTKLARYEASLNWSNPVEQMFTNDKGSDRKKGAVVQIIKKFDQGQLSIGDNLRLSVQIYKGTEKKSYATLAEFESLTKQLMSAYRYLLPQETTLYSFCDRSYEHDYFCTSEISAQQATIEEELIERVQHFYTLVAFGQEVDFFDNEMEVEKIGDFQIKSLKQAEKEMRQGNFYKAGPPIVITENEQIALWELTYLQPGTSYLYPFYVFYLDLQQEETGMSVYQIVYVPAMMDEDIQPYLDQSGYLQ